MKALFLFLFLSLTLGASVGSVVYTKGESYLMRADKKLQLAVGMGLEKNDTLFTKKEALVKLLLEDKTALSIGQNSSFKIEDYLFDAKENSRADFRMEKGLFRIITGEIAKMRPDKFKLKTKTVTIGIRGTIFSLIIEKGQESLFCEHGEVYVSSQGVVQDLKEGYKSVIQAGEAPGRAKPYYAIELNKLHSQLGGWRDKKCK